MNSIMHKRMQKVDAEMKPNYLCYFGLALFCAITIASIPLYSSATGVSVKVGEDGKIYAVAKPASGRFSANCENLKVNLLAQQVTDQKPSLIATVIIQNGDDKRALRLIDELKDHIDENHSIINMRFGCLSGNGGAGIILESINAETENVFIQIDKYGRVFKGFNQTGYTLIEPENQCRHFTPPRYSANSRPRNPLPLAL